MSRKHRLSAAEKAVEEIRTIRRRLWKERDESPSDLFKRLAEERRASTVRRAKPSSRKGRG